MNKVEKMIYDSVKSLPWLKIFIRNIYQGIFDLFPQPAEFSIAPITLKEGYFYGYHDSSPFSYDNSKVLANKLHFDLRMPSQNDIIDVGYFRLENGDLGSFHKIDESASWNYHKGCRLQWLTKNKVIYNVYEEDKVRAKIYDLENGVFQYMLYPVDSVSADGALATSFSYQRLEKFMPGYGYIHSDSDSYLEDASPSDSGLFLLDLTSGERRLLVSLEELAKKSIKEKNSTSSSHYVTHSLFSPDGRYISFFHRWVGEDTRKRYTRLVIFDLERNSYVIAPTGYMVSHYVWNSRGEIVAYCNHRGIDCHVLIKIPNFEDSKPVAYPILNSDGHQSFITDTKFVTDTYANRRRMAKLYSVDIETNEVELLASVYSPSRFQTKVPHKHIACDLHPRMSPDGRYVCFDTVKTNVRSLAIMRVPY